MVRYAVISDIHGNLPALKSVEIDFNALGIDRVINLGDHASGPLWPRETLDYLIHKDWMHISGNHDKELSFGNPQIHGLSDAFAFKHSTPEQQNWLRQLPPHFRWDEEVSGFHGSPSSDEEHLLEETSGGRKVLRKLTDIESQLSLHTVKIFLCGHSHIPRCIRLGWGCHVINPGSVGLQAFKEIDPKNPALSYRVENGSPHARYAILENRHDWEVALSTGFSEDSLK